MWGGVAHELDTYGPFLEYGDSPKTSAGFMHSFEELCITHCGKEGKLMAAAVGWPLLWVVWWATDTQLEAESRVRKLEK